MCRSGSHAIIAVVHAPALDRFARHRQGRLVAGVCAGVARGLRLDVSVVRLGVLVLALAGGFGIVLYGALWVVLPVDSEATTAAPAHRVDDVAALAVVVGVMLVLRAAGIWISD